MKKRILTLFALAVVTVGAWADPTMTITVSYKNGNNAIVVLSAVSMTRTSDDHHFSYSYDVPAGEVGKTYYYKATYNNGTSYESGQNYCTPSSATTIKFYAKFFEGVNKTAVTCDAMTQSFCQNNWKLLGQLKASIGAESVSTLLNIYESGSKAYQQLDGVPHKDTPSDVYWLSYRNKMGGTAIKVGDTYSFADKPSLTLTPGIYRATLSYAECTLELERLSTYKLSIGSAGTATLCLPYQVTLDENLTAYTLSYDGTNKLKGKIIEGNVVPAKTPILITGPQRDYDIALDGASSYDTFFLNNGKDPFLKDIEPTEDSDEDGYEDNVLHGVMAPHYVQTTGDNYVLQNNGGKLGFYKVGIDTYLINPFKAFVNLPSASEARSLSIVFDDSETTGIADVKGKKEEGRSDIFNLSGQRVGKDYKGVVIKNGRKMIQK